MNDPNDPDLENQLRILYEQSDQFKANRRDMPREVKEAYKVIRDYEATQRHEKRQFISLFKQRRSVAITARQAHLKAQGMSPGREASLRWLAMHRALNDEIRESETAIAEAVRPDGWVKYVEDPTY